ncbi:calcium-binding protein [Cochlodiniinecator piscidefendens]|uniref:hypothetical protein n=1 Tax=Cochlodiniinecator piscidefendens TaxID=2715756 RepID=UPI00140A5C7D|nr:hypothetical protein [Cochlodiniinecator piscidefendens]
MIELLVLLGVAFLGSSFVNDASDEELSDDVNLSDDGTEEGQAYSTYHEGSETVEAGAGDDIITGYYLHSVPGDITFIGEDFDSDYIDGGSGDDIIKLASADRGVGGTGNDTFIISSQIEDGEVAQILDFSSGEDIICIEFPSQMNDENLTTIQPEEIEVDIVNSEDGSNSTIVINGKPIANVFGDAILSAASIELIFQE